VTAAGEMTAPGPYTTARNFCGCCGASLARGRPDDDWCTPCKKHIAPVVLQGVRNAPWDRTYFAQFKKDCPYQVTAS
jgi:hypothetical protein